MWFDKAGKEITIRDAEEYRNDVGYWRIGQETLPDGKIVSTVWLGLSHGQDAQGRPLIFETMVYPGKDANAIEQYQEFSCTRFATEQDAKAFHQALVLDLTSKLKAG